MKAEKDGNGTEKDPRGKIIKDSNTERYLKKESGTNLKMIF